MDVEGEADKSQEKLFFIHSRNSSFNSLAGDGEEDSEMLLKNVHKPVRPDISEKSDGPMEDSRTNRCKITVTGKCMCKLSLVFYLATCITVSALYVAFYGKNQAFFGDAWIPGKVSIARCTTVSHK